jgi:hypothetical protein
VEKINLNLSSKFFLLSRLRGYFTLEVAVDQHEPYPADLPDPFTHARFVRIGYRHATGGYESPGDLLPTDRVKQAGARSVRHPREATMN